MKKCIISFVLFLFFLAIPSSVHAQAVCPAQGDTKTNFDTATNKCYSHSDVGFNAGLNTQGGQTTCGPVRCPGDHTSPYNPGNTCIVKKNNQCFAGTGPSGFDTPGCTAASTSPLAGCPQPMGLRIQVNDVQGKPIPNATYNVTIHYEDSAAGKNDGKTKIVSVKTDTLGQATITGVLYSGDHFTLSMSGSISDAFSPTQIGNNTNIGDQEMNTPTSCGTQMENGTYNKPCAFTHSITANLTIIPANNAAPKLPPDRTVINAEQSVATTLQALAVIGIIAVGINGMLGLGSDPKK